MKIIRKATGRVVDSHISEEMLEVVLSCLPFGVYDIETSKGNYIKTAIVKRRSVTYVTL